MKVQGTYGEAIIYNDNAEAGVITQVQELLNTKLAEDAHIRIMPDCHQGAGCVIGTTMRITDKVCPNLVGVDIGCGVLAVKLGAIGVNLDYLDSMIRKIIPHGFSIHDKIHRNVARTAEGMYAQLKYRDIDYNKFAKSLGTLGGGNHFIEMATDEGGDVWLLIHSGSRNTGLRVATHYQKVAMEECSDDVPKELKYLTATDSESYFDYLHDMRVMQSYAEMNRVYIAETVLNILCIELLGFFDTPHNYIGEDNILRKGAVLANAKFVVPLNMADGTLICSGKGNTQWNNSSPHGAGRIYSRSKAKKELSMDDFNVRMSGVYSTCISEATLDESPMAYKNSDEIKQLIQPTADILTVLKPIYNFKAN